MNEDITASVQDECESRSIEDLAAIPIVLQAVDSKAHDNSILNVPVIVQQGVDYDKEMTTEYWADEFSRRKCCARTLTTWASIRCQFHVGLGKVQNIDTRQFCRRQRQRALERAFFTWTGIIDSNLCLASVRSHEKKNAAKHSNALFNTEQNVQGEQKSHAPTPKAFIHQLSEPGFFASGTNTSSLMASSGRYNSNGITNQDIAIDVDDVEIQQDSLHISVNGGHGHAESSLQHSRCSRPNRTVNANGDHRSSLERHQHDGLIQDIMSAALVGPQYLEQKLLRLYRSGDLDDGTPVVSV